MRKQAHAADLLPAGRAIEPWRQLWYNILIFYAGCRETNMPEIKQQTITGYLGANESLDPRFEKAACDLGT